MSAEFRPQAAGNQHASTEQTSAEQAYTDLQDFLQTHEQKPRLYPRAVLAGGLAGILAVAFQWSLVGSEALRHRMILWAYQYPHWGWLLPMLVSAAGAGVAIYMVRNIAPEVAGIGSGHQLREVVLVGGIGLSIIPLWFVLRFGLTMISYDCGAPGGIFTPLLVLGALIGLAVGDLTHLLMPRVGDHPAAFAVVGMAAYFPAIVRAPLTGIVLIVEMTNNYEQMLALLVACFSAHLIAEAMGDRPIYEALLDRDIRRSGNSPELQGMLVLDLIVQPGSPFDGKRVKELELPPGCILVTRRQGLRESAPTAGTRLEAGDRITAVVSSQASAGIPLLWDGCESVHASHRSGTSPPAADSPSQSS
jgi:Voltage gated chloride channel/TrkA-C domain